MITYIIIVFTFAILLRTLVLFKYKFVGIDTFFHILRACVIKKEGRIKELTQRSSKIKQILITSRWWIYYPKLFDIFLSFFPHKFHKYFKFIPVIFDIFCMVILYLFTSSLFNSQVVILSLIIYSLSPILILVCLSLSPRTFSNLFLILSSLMLLLYFLSHNFLFIIVSSFFVLFIYLSHKLTLQSLFVVFISESLVFHSYAPLVVLLFGFLASVILTKKSYLKILDSHIRLLKLFLTKGFKLRKKMKELIFTFGSFPFILIFLFTQFSMLYNNNVKTFITTWFFSLFFASLIWLWGDSYRYMTNAVFPGSILAAITIDLNNFLFSYVFFFSALFSLFGIIKIFKIFSKPPRIINSDIISCFNYVKRHCTQNDILVTIPFQYYTAAAYFTKIQSFGLRGKDIKVVLSKGRILNKKVSWIVSNSKISSKIFKLKFSSKNFFVYKCLR